MNEEMINIKHYLEYTSLGDGCVIYNYNLDYKMSIFRELRRS